jgi:hypothetical protein
LTRLPIGDRERVQRLDEEEIERGRRQHRGGRARSSTAKGSDEDREQKRHRLICVARVRRGDQSDAGRNADGDERDDVCASRRTRT